MAEGPAENWPQWRGPNHDGTSDTAADMPIRWSRTENVKWRVKAESWSAATPIVWGDVVLITSAEAGFNDPLKYGEGTGRVDARPQSTGRDKLFLLALNREDGSILWKKETGGNNQIFRKHNMASPSPVTDGEKIWVLTGVGTLTAFDFNGNQLWQRDLQADYGEFGLNWGYASSPKLHEDRLFIQVLHGMTTDDPSYVMAVDKDTGKNLWRIERPTDAPRESPDNYATPILTEVDGKLQLIVSGGDYVTGHDIDSGEELWRLGGFNPTQNGSYRTIASSLALDDKVFTTSRQGRPFIGFKPGGSGDVTGEVELWTNDLGTDVPTPTTDGERLFVVNDRGILTVLDPDTGEVIGERKRLEPGTYSASPLLADGKLYATSEDGATTVVRADESLEILAVNKLDEYTLASPAAAGNQIFIRTMDYVYCIE
jgi:outer membrane protein assembly factor BamB